jgi:hypothetical protein
VESAGKTKETGQNDELASNEKGPELGMEPSYEYIPPALTAARLALVRQVQTVIGNGLTLLGISAPEKM